MKVPKWHPFPVISFFGFHFWKFSIWYGPQTGNLPLLVLGVTYFGRQWQRRRLHSSSSGVMVAVAAADMTAEATAATAVSAVTEAAAVTKGAGATEGAVVTAG